MSKNNYDYIAIVNAVNQQMGGMYGYEFPIINSDTFGAMSAAFIDAPQMIKNAYIDTLRNIICNVAIKKVYRANNPFKKLYREDTVLTGDGKQYIEEVAIDQFIPLAYEMAGDPNTFFKSAPPKVKVQILCNVLRKKYVVTLNQFVLEPAFRSLESFGNFWTSCIDRLYADMEEDDKEEILKAINSIIEGGNMYIMPSTRPIDTSTALKFQTDLNILSRDLSFMRSRKYNLQHLSTKTDEGDAILIVSGDVISVLNSYNLAWAYNRQYLDLLNAGQMIELDSNGLAGNKAFAMFTDTDFFRIHNVKNFPILKTWENGENLEEKKWLHNWKMINFSYASNAVCFVEPKHIGIEKIELFDKDGNTSSTIKQGKFKQLALPKVTATADKLADCFCNYTISGNSSNDTRVDQDGTIYIAKDETIGGSLTVTATSHLDNNITSSYNITVS